MASSSHAAVWDETAYPVQDGAQYQAYEGWPASYDTNGVYDPAYGHDYAAQPMVAHDTYPPYYDSSAWEAAQYEGYAKETVASNDMAPTYTRALQPQGLPDAMPSNSEQDRPEAWAIDSDADTDDDSLGEDFDAYKDFNNVEQGPQHHLDSHPESHDKRHPYGAAPPMSSRPAAHPLVQLPPNGADLYPTIVDVRHAHGFLPDKRGTKSYNKLLGASDSQLDLADIAPLGDEFTSEERHRMTRAFRRWHRRNQHLGKIDSWLRGYNPVCGWLGPQAALIIGFVLVVIIAVMLYFVIPRVPELAPVTKDPLTPANGRSDMELVGSPTGFSMNGTLHLRVDNTAGWVPSHLLSLQTTVTYIPTKMVVGKGNAKSQWIPGHTKSALSIPIMFSHTSLNATGDDTQLAFQDACAHFYQGTQRSTLSLHVDMQMDIGGILGTHQSTFDLNDIECPWELPK